MKKLLVFVIFSISIQLTGYCQGTVRGRITDENGETLPGVTIMLKSKPTVGVITDLEGRFSINIPENKIDTLVISLISYKTLEEMINLKKGEIIVKDITLSVTSKTLKEVEVIAKGTRAKEGYMDKIKAKSATSIEVLTSESIRRIGDSRLDEAVKRITGVSTVGGYITVRGLADRYLKTTINGSRIPTLDPFTNNIKLDMFPSNLIDNIIITKTASPDLPGDWSGSYISVETKDYPEKLTINVTSTLGYNNQSTFKDIISAHESKTDWLGFDNGFRNIQHLSGKDFPQFNDNISTYDEFVALGLGSYLNSQGITEANIGTAVDNIYYRMGLVQLGILKPALIYDQESVNIATNTYRSDPQYQAKGRELINQPSKEFSKTLPNNWEPTTKKTPFNFSQEFSIGNQTKLFKRPLGYIFGFRYSNSIKYDPNSPKSDASAESEVVQDAFGRDSVTNLYRVYNYKISSETSTWSALLNLSYSLGPNNSISLVCMPNFSGTNYAHIAEGNDDLSDLTKGLKYKYAQSYEDRKQLIYQLQTSNFIPKIRLKTELNVSFTKGNSNILDAKRFSLYKNGDLFEFDSGTNLFRTFGYLSEDLIDSRFSAELPLGNTSGITRKIKFGAAYQKMDRNYDRYRYSLNSTGGGSIAKISDYFENKAIYTSEIKPTNFSFGKSAISAGYILIDYSLSVALRLSGGVRVEYSDVLADSREFYNLGLPANDSLRTVYGLNQFPANAGILKEYNYLPSINLIYRLNKSEQNPKNLRFNYSQSLARPSIRELAQVYNYDFGLDREVVGNPNLKTVIIDNYDFRIESFFSNGDNVSLSLFYKKIENHIEIINSAHIYWENAKKAYAYGVEVEGKKQIFKNLTLRANVTWINSSSSIYITDGLHEDRMETHPMFGQAPFLINGILDYALEKIGLSAAISYNVQGPKLSLVTIGAIPDIYEMPQHLLDFKLSKSLNKYFSLSFKARNILNSPIQRSFKMKEGWIVDFDNYTYGTDLSLSITYNL